MRSKFPLQCCKWLPQKAYLHLTCTKVSSIPIRVERGGAVEILSPQRPVSTRCAWRGVQQGGGEPHTGAHAEGDQLHPHHRGDPERIGTDIVPVEGGRSRSINLTPPRNTEPHRTPLHSTPLHPTTPHPTSICASVTFDTLG